MPKITIYVPDEAPVKFGFEEETEVTVGRADENDIVIQHDSISGNHAKFVKSGDTYNLFDLESTNGTFLDGELASNTPVYNGNRVTFGQVDADFESDVEAPGAEEGGEDEAEGEEGGFGESEGLGEEYTTNLHAEIAESSARPAGLKNLSPIPKIEKKDSVGKAILAVGILAIVASAAVAVATVVMQVP